MSLRAMLTQNKVITGKTSGYPDIQPLRVKQKPSEVFSAVEKVASSQGNWRNIEADQENHKLTAEAVTRLLKFVDDVEIWLTEEDGETVVWMKSQSRVGKADFGANAKRIRNFLAELESAL